MDQLVTAKVRLTEVEGDCLQSRRALVRAREKEMALAKQIKEVRAGPLERGPIGQYPDSGGLRRTIRAIFSARK